MGEAFERQSLSPSVIADLARQIRGHQLSRTQWQNLLEAILSRHVDGDGTEAATDLIELSHVGRTISGAEIIEHCVSLLTICRFIAAESPRPQQQSDEVRTPANVPASAS